MMGKQVTLTLSNELYEQAQRWADITRRDLAETLTDALSIALAPVYGDPQLEKPVSSLSDEEVLDLCEIKMESVQGRRLGRLLKRQREGELSDEERRELQALVQVYSRLWIRQSEALAEAVRRRLREPLAP